MEQDEGPDSLSARDRLAQRITDALEHDGFFLTQVDPRPHQLVIDARWAAQMAGRHLGRRTSIRLSRPGRQVHGKIAVVVALAEETAKVQGP